VQGRPGSRKGAKDAKVAKKKETLIRLARQLKEFPDAGALAV
jgi:ribosomal protein L19E